MRASNARRAKEESQQEQIKTKEQTIREEAI